MNKAIYLIFLAKSIRTFMFGVISILIPIYLASLNYPVFYVTLGIFFVVLGNVVFNLLLALYESLIRRKNFLLYIAYS